MSSDLQSRRSDAQSKCGVMGNFHPCLRADRASRFFGHSKSPNSVASSSCYWPLTKTTAYPVELCHSMRPQLGHAVKVVLAAW